MRTTLTLDDDIAAKLKAEARRSGRSFKAAVNDLLRLGPSIDDPDRCEPSSVLRKNLWAAGRVSARMRRVRPNEALYVSDDKGGFILIAHSRCPTSGDKRRRAAA